MKIYRDADGNLINIGDWQDPVDINGVMIANPLPEGAYEEEAEVVTGQDGGLYLADDPRVQ